MIFDDLSKNWSVGCDCYEDGYSVYFLDKALGSLFPTNLLLNLGEKTSLD